MTFFPSIFKILPPDTCPLNVGSAEDGSGARVVAGASRRLLEVKGDTVGCDDDGGLTDCCFTDVGDGSVAVARTVGVEIPRLLLFRICDVAITRCRLLSLLLLLVLLLLLLLTLLFLLLLLRLTLRLSGGSDGGSARREEDEDDERFEWVGRL